MVVKALSAIKCVPNSRTAKCWKIKLTDDLTTHKGKGLEFHVKIIVNSKDVFYKANLNDKGESIIFTADEVKHDDVYFNLKILPDYKSIENNMNDVFNPQKEGDELVPLIWGTNDVVLDALSAGGGCATRLSYLLNRAKDCKYTYPRLLNDSILRANWTDYATKNPLPGFRSHAINKNRTYIGGDSYEPIKGTVYKPGEKKGSAKNFNYISSVKSMLTYISTTYTDAPNVQYGNYNLKGGNAPKKKSGDYNDPTDAKWLGVAVRAEGHGHSDIAGSNGYTPITYLQDSEAEINYFKFTKIEPKGGSPLKENELNILAFKHILN